MSEQQADFETRARAAAFALREVFEPTPLVLNPFLSARYEAEIWLKREDLSPVRSYKIRGAFNAMRHAIADGTTRFVCASAGNHAQGVAYAARHFGVTATVFMPVTTPQQKIEKTRVFGEEAVEIRLTGDYFDDTLTAAQAYCAETGAHFLSPFDDEDVILGQASVALEVLDQMEGAPDLFVLPVGGGGLSSGMRAVLKTAAPGAGMILAEPAGGASLAAALVAGAPVTLDSVDSFVDGAAVARIGAKTFQILEDVPMRDVFAVPEDRICTTILEMLNHEGIVLEPAGALPVDVLKDLGTRIRGKRVVVVTSGGNFDFERLPEVKERAMRSAGVKKYYLLRMPQRPGALRDFLELLGPDDDIARFEYLKKSARNFGTVLIGIETSAAENFERLESALNAGGFTFQDITADETLAEFVI
ncbi:threonine ammonia-lyase IlvA [Ovoidimarina sediminis]|uniref:threonine ammonia-lyase IlvA n=1 Tax=Ovoidimarina sediminis TaxID=3079856 RepID=UPI00290DFBA3|nr:threonine ammonia-lyase IlvA [Rhodophyticola sp. MJ-SS7]MDU8944538.1 threonine ammonia-lyase IlvA [Rhodophyticola sp. MJ-SS7]